MKRWVYNISIALEAVMLNRFRSLLTALGIIFGVAAVIAMMAIGQGAKKEILDQIKLVGVNNIIVIPQRHETPNESQTAQRQTVERYSPGLTLLDLENIKESIPGIAHISPEVNYQTEAIRSGRGDKIRLRGVNTAYFDIFNLNTVSGNLFNVGHIESASAVCVIGSAIRVKFFPNEDPIGKRIKCGSIWLTVLGVLESRGIPGELSGMGISDHDASVYTPVTTILLRFRDRSLITAALLRGNEGSSGGGSVSSGAETSEEDVTAENHQLSKIVVQMESSEQLKPAEEVLNRLLLRRHGGVQDFRVSIPEALLKQEQRTRDIFNIVLGAIAGIALLVGGIGIMNIMLASVMERIKEIGIRQAMGARRSDIVFQFLAESTLISIIGGGIGVALGIILSQLIMQIAGILTIISIWSILLSFGVAAIIGVAFGFMPARKAAQQDPVVSLRYE